MISWPPQLDTTIGNEDEVTGQLFLTCNKKCTQQKHTNIVLATLTFSSHFWPMCIQQVTIDNGSV